VAETITLAPDDAAYPPVLRALASPEKPPPTLYVRGELPRLPGIAVVGRRAASAEAITFTRALVHDLAAAGFSVWSGGALGVDAAAHEAALSARAPTVVVAGAGLSNPYPAEHAPLFDRVLRAGGALVSRLPDPTPPRPAHFLARNQVLAAMTVATVVVEAGLQSGARSASAAARRLGRPLCVVPHPPWSEAGAGCAEELVLGARAVTCAKDVLAAIGHGPAPLRRRSAVRPEPTTLPLPLQTGEKPTLGRLEQTILGVLTHRPMHVDVICATVGAPLPAVAGALLTLTLQAVVVEGPAGSYRRGTR
jgi:DNA processing protein